MRISMVVVAACFCAAMGFAQRPLPITEKIEWTWTDRAEKPDAALPNVLLVGDSITRGYFPAVSDELKGVANVYLFATSAADDARLPVQLRDYFSMMGVKFAVVHFNNGMHGWGYGESDYAAGLWGMVAALRAGAPEAKLVWATTTPVLHDSTKGEATNARIDARNRAAAVLLAREGVTVDDQHALMLGHSELHSGDVHFKEEGGKLQGAQAAATIRTALGKH